MKLKFLTKQDLDFDPEAQSFLFSTRNTVVDKIAERLAKEIEKRNYEFGDEEKYYCPREWSRDQKTNMLRTQITMFLPTLNDTLEEYFSIRNTSLGTSLNTLNFMFCFTNNDHYMRPFARSFIQLLDKHHERLDFAEKDTENRIITQDLKQFEELRNNFNLESVNKDDYTSHPFWAEVLRIYITDVIHFVKNHDVFKILGNITNTEVALGRNDAEMIEDCFTFYKGYIRGVWRIKKLPEKERLPGKFSDSYMAVSSRKHLLSPENPKHIDEINRIIETCKISEETLDKFSFFRDPSTISLSDDDMDSTIDPDDQEEISAAESTYWRDALTPRPRRHHLTKDSRGDLDEVIFRSLSANAKIPNEPDPEAIPPKVLLALDNDIKKTIELINKYTKNSSEITR